MNPIVQAIARVFASEEIFFEVLPDDPINPKGIVVVLKNGGDIRYEIKCKDRDEFMKHWREASGWWEQVQWRKMDNRQSSNEESS